MEIVRRTVALYKDNRDLFAHYLKLLFLPYAFIVVAAEMLTAYEAKVQSTVSSLLLFLIFISAQILLLWISIALIRTIAGRYEGREGILPKAGLRDATALILPMFWVSILSGLAVLGGFLLLFIPGILFSIWFAFANYAVLMDDKRGVAALSFSKLLVKGRWWETLVRLTLPAILFGAIGLLAQTIIGIPANALLKSMQEGTLPFVFLSIVTGLFAVAMNVFLIPLFSGAPTILYLELKKTPLQITHTPDHPNT